MRSWVWTIAFLALWPLKANGQQFVVNQPAGPVVPGLQEQGQAFGSPEDALRQSLAQKTSRLGLEPFYETQEAGYSILDGATLLRDFCARSGLTCLCTLLGVVCVVLCGVLPALLLPRNTSPHDLASEIRLNRLLSFAVGSLLGDVFLHLLPEAWNQAQNGLSSVGLWIIAGLLICFLIEKCCASSEDSQHQVTAMMNLVANMVDNFTHGLAVGGSFLVNIKFGFLTTFAILIHEIPHEISDFAILLRADFNRWSAIKAQLVTAVGGVLGAGVALATAEEGWAGGAWILPFTAGGFLNIALVQVLPELMRESNPREGLMQICLILLGVVVMGGLNLLHLA